MYAKHIKEEYVQGDMFEKNAIVGPQVSKQQFDKILSYIDIGKKEGARVILGGEKFRRKYVERILC